jgi:hypothetical protein
MYSFPFLEAWVNIFTKSSAKISIPAWARRGAIAVFLNHKGPGKASRRGLLLL